MTINKNNNHPEHLFWFRRDLRLDDNVGLYHSLHKSTICCYIWDQNYLDNSSKIDPKIDFINQIVADLKNQLQKLGSDLIILYGEPKQTICKLINKYNISGLFYNEEYEPELIKRDKQINKTLLDMKVSVNIFQDHLIFAKQQILNQNQKPYMVYTPYKKSWLSNLTPQHYTSYNTKELLKNLFKIKIPQEIVFTPNKTNFISKSFIQGNSKATLSRLNNFISNIDNYHLTRDYPALNSTSFLGADLRFGTISIRKLVQLALSRHSSGADIWLSELIWREFFSQILYNFPSVVNQAFHKEYNSIKYDFNKNRWDAWCNGTTGYPIVDAGMRQLNQTGFMHNRIRMVCASFLCKDLLHDWRLGEKYFADHLLDYDLSSNNGNWQWCASTGCDAQPYFRIFNPQLQSLKYDPEGNYIRKYVPELLNLSTKQVHLPHMANDLLNENDSLIDYPKPIVNHKEQSQKAKALFKHK